MKEILESLEKRNNELDILKFKIAWPQIYSSADLESDLLKVTQEISDLKNQARNFTDIDVRRELLYGQLTEYINAIERPHHLAFSKGQGFGFPMFYINPSINVRDIALFHQNGLVGVNYNLTMDEKDSVSNKHQFLQFITDARSETLSLNNLVDIYDFYRQFISLVHRDFC